jgi:AraC-like DNA-binding protein
MRRIAAEMGGANAPVFRRALIDDARLAAAIWQAHRLSEGEDATAAESAMLAALRLLLAHANRTGRQESVEGSNAGRRVALCQRIIEGNLGFAPDLQQLAKAVGVTRFQVIRDFKQVLGVTPAAFIRDRRLRRANKLIEAGSSLVDAALEAGFADQSHLSRLFRAAHGYTLGMLKRAG